MDKSNIKETIVHKLFELYDPSSKQNWHPLLSFTMDVPLSNWNDIPEALSELVSAGIIYKIPVHVQGTDIVYYWYQINTGVESEYGNN